MSKQDRQGARTVTDLERKYNFGETFAEFLGIANDARKAASDAEAAAKGVDEKLTQEELFNRLTNNGTAQGIYRDENGEIYINASYIVAGILRSADGESLVLDLDNGTAELTGSLTTVAESTDNGYEKTTVFPTGIRIVASSDGSNSYKRELGVGYGGFRIANHEQGYTSVMHDKGYYVANNNFPGNEIRAAIDPYGDGSRTEFYLCTDSANPLKLVSEGGVNRMWGLAAPTTTTEAANKEYVDGLYNKIVTALAANGITVE